MGRRSKITVLAPALAALVCLLWPAAALAHEMGGIRVDVAFDDHAGYRAVVTIDKLHLPRPLSPFPTGAFLDGVSITFDGVRSAWRLDPPATPAAGDGSSDQPSLVLVGEVPPGAESFRWSQPLALGQYLLNVSWEGDAEPTPQWLDSGAVSRPYVLRTAPRPPSIARVVGQYVVLGVTHIVPQGLDHILFVLGLFLLSLKPKALLIQITAFTLAHSLTLALCMYGVVSVASSIVEPLIALSIVVVAVENILTTRVRAWRTGVVFAFGLLHGLGFAGVLRELGLPRSQFLPALVSFNVGVELGQLSVVCAAYLGVGLWFGKRPWYRARITVPASFAIALVGLYWTIERVIPSL